MKRVVYGVGPAALLALVALWEVAVIARAGRDTGSTADWAAAAAAVRAEHRAGDLIVFAPGWIDPVGRHHLGDLIPVAMAARMDAARYARIWELSVRGARAPEVRAAAAAWTGDFGAVTVRRYEQTPAEVLTDFVEAFPLAEVSGAIGRRSRDRDVKPAVDLEEVGFAPHRCVRVLPTPDGTVRVLYRDVALGSTLVGYVGLADVFTRRDDRDPARLTARVGADEVATTVGVDDGWVRFELATSPGTGDVVFEATALGPRARNRLVCFAAEARR